RTPLSRWERRDAALHPLADAHRDRRSAHGRPTRRRPAHLTVARDGQRPLWEDRRVGPPAGDHVAEGRAALRAGDAAAARRALEAAASAGESGEIIEGFAQASYLELDYPTAITEWERAYAAYRAEGDEAGAVRSARTLGCMYGTFVGDWAVAGGWL